VGEGGGLNGQYQDPPASLSFFPFFLNYVINYYYSAPACEKCKETKQNIG